MKAPTLLFVEDDDDARDPLGRALERAGYACLLANGVQQALSQLSATTTCDLVITDIVLGSDERGGLDLIAELRARGITAPVVLITAFADVEKLKLGLNLRAAHLLEKPFRASELIEVIEGLLAPRQQPQPPHAAAEQVLRAAALTDKERTVARYLLDGLSSTAIAEMEQNSAKTIRQHVSRIYAKCGVTNRAEFFRLMYTAPSSP